jgi:hypothetical protein
VGVAGGEEAIELGSREWNHINCKK